MPEFTVFDADTGRILNSGQCGSLAQIAIQSQGNTQIVLGQAFNPATYYVLADEAIPRPRVCEVVEYSMNADGAELFEISEIPAGTVIVWQGQEHQLDDGLFEFITAVPGIYELVLQPPFPFQRQIIRINAHAV